MIFPSLEQLRFCILLGELLVTNLSQIRAINWLGPTDERKIDWYFDKLFRRILDLSIILLQKEIPLEIDCFPIFGLIVEFELLGDVLGEFFFC